MGDIVERLRDKWKHSEEGCYEAADEIERLNAENERLREILATIVMHYPQGINPWLDDACNAARAALAEGEK